jgi:tRNA pseudouridine38-40 synthase
MNQAAELLLKYTDFTSFSKLHSDAKTNICHIYYARWVQVATDYWRFEIKADRFLRNMVRAIVGTLLEVGRGRLALEDFTKVIEAKSRNSAGESVPAKGLFLVAVDYC